MNLDNSTAKQDVGGSSSGGEKRTSPIKVGSQDDIDKIPIIDRVWFRVMLAFLPVVPGFFIALFSYYQYLHNQAIFSTTQETLRVSQSAFRSTEWMQRPWVGISTLLGNPGSLGMCLMPELEYKYDGKCKPKRPDVFTYITSKEKLRGYVAVRNTGNSPAIGTVLKARWCVSAKPPDVPPAFVECSNTEQTGQPWTDGPRVLFPGNGDSTLDVTGTFFVPTEDVVAIRKKEKWFYYIGTVTYDREDKPLDHAPAYSTDFCIFYDPRGHGEDFSLYYCPRGNIAR
ncbi:MAG: hypothetical protein H8K06_20305 [Nitrospira sp.]|uniref:Uncharacterized protein n=1 Tax=Nitrospira defluvii TaxID=330214 RepID=A0ABM8QG63_9BACT|nr:hypothetical protein [Nitrospira sp.]CAE6695366.1 conserved hypothetical protein [Nitrospira defluvii]